jgi:hypothetical protein
VWLWACDVVVRNVRGGLADRVFGVVYGWSARVIAMYFIHWIIVGWGIAVVGLRALELGPALVGTVVTLALTHYLSIPRRRFDIMRWLHAPLLRLESRPASGAANVRDPRPADAVSGQA